MTTGLLLTNARIVLPGDVVAGTVELRGGRVASVESGASGNPAAVDLDGDYLIPGVVDLHTDNLERQVQPRTNARWPSRSALVAHDAQCAAAGVTTVLDALCLGNLGFEKDRVRTFREGIADLDALAGTGLLKAEHFLHLRCELPAPDMPKLLEPMAGHPRVRMVSMMDHSPRRRPVFDLDRYKALRIKEGGVTMAFVEEHILFLLEQRARLRDPNRRALLALLAGRGIALASHDDRTTEEIAENKASGIGISEFPVTMLAAEAAKAAGMDVIAGAPNIVRGGSHSGNVAAADLVRADAVDAFASDYVPASLIEAAFRCTREPGISLPRAAALISYRPARMAGLDDRGRIAEGLRADLVRVRLHDDLPIVREVWRAGQRVA